MTFTETKKKQFIERFKPERAPKLVTFEEYEEVWSFIKTTISETYQLALDSYDGVVRLDEQKIEKEAQEEAVREGEETLTKFAHWYYDKHGDGSLLADVEDYLKEQK